MSNRYLIPCLTEGVDVFDWADVKPTACPHDAAHSIDSDGIVLVDLGQQDPIYSGIGGLVTSPTYSHFDEDGSFYGSRTVCAANTVTFTDIEITSELFIRYGMCWFVAANDGDIVEISLVDKDDVLGLFTALGYEVGVDVLELGKLAENIPMYPGNTPWTKFDTGDTAPVIEGLYLRLKYDNDHATQATVMGMVFNWFKGS